MIKSEKQLVIEGRLPSYDDNSGGWHVVEKPNPRENDRGIRNAAMMLDWVLGKQARMTVENMKTSEKRVFEGKVVLEKDGLGWLLQELPNTEKMDTGIRDMPVVLQWAIGNQVRITIEDLS
jgi:hypothetical protein